MSYEIVNTLKNSSVIRAEGDGTYTIQLSDLSANSNLETVTSASIRSIMWSSNGSITVARGDTPNTVLTLFLGGEMRFDDIGHTVANGSTGDIVITIATGGTVVMETTKTATYNRDLGRL